MIGIFTYYFKSTKTKENISKVNSIEKNLNKNFQKSISSDKSSNNTIVNSSKKQTKNYTNILLSKAVVKSKNELTEREKYEKFLMNHPFNNRNRISNNDSSELNGKVESEESKEQETPRLAYEQDYLRTMNPKLHRPTPEVLQGIMFNSAVNQFSKALMGLPGAIANNKRWDTRGPKNVGGRTRALAWDPNDVTGKKVWAGSVSGGLWYNNDITNDNSQWVPVNDMWRNLSITKIVFDPNNPNIIYVATGEGFIYSLATRGEGIWKSVDAGQSWAQLSTTTDMTFINDLAIRNESGVSVLYAAIDGKDYKGTSSGYIGGLVRSSNGGQTWVQVMRTNGIVNNVEIPYAISSISIAADNRIYVGTKNYSNEIDLSDQGGGKILYSDDGVNWVLKNYFNTTTGTGRVSIATAPSNSNYVYAFIEKKEDSIALIKSTNKGGTWYYMNLPIEADITIPSSDFANGQGFYNQMIKVDPNNPQTIYVGGIDLFKSTDSGSSWSQISKWTIDPLFGMTTLPFSIVHADQHVMEFKPGSSTTAIFGNDGGVYYTNNLENASSSDIFVKKNNYYNITQFYSAAMHPNPGTNYYIGGAQDNGNLKFISPGISSENKANDYGDGANAFIDQSNPLLQIVSAPKNFIAISTDAGNSFTNAPLQQETLQFINPACYDNNLHIYYSDGLHSDINNNPVFGYIYRRAILPSSYSNGLKYISALSILNTYATAFKVSPYTTGSTTLFIGTANGQIIKVKNANGSSIPNNIISKDITTQSDLLPAGSISSIDLGADENHILVTYFNYGIEKIWYTEDGGANWVSKMGTSPNNFPDIPVRWALINPNNRTNDVILATELGIYGTLNFSSTSPTWTQLNNGFANVRTDMLQYRPSDNQVIAATHGRGLYSSMGFVSAPTITSFLPTTAGAGTQVTIDGTELGSVTAVSFGGVAASTFTVTSSTRIIASVGNGASGNVSVINPASSAIKSGFTYCVTSDANLSSGVNSNNQTVCQNTVINNITYSTTYVTSVTSSGLPPGLTASLSSNVVTISGSPTTAGVYNFTINFIGGCQTITRTATITVTASNTLTLSSAAGTNSQTVCINNPIANITYNTTGASGANVTGLPTGVSKTWASNVLTISGTPILAGVYTYTINLSGGCSSVTTLGYINVNANSVAGTATASSSTICSGNTTTLSLSGNTGSIIWQQSSNGTTGWANVTTGTGSTTSSYTTAALPTTSYFRALVTNGACSSVNSNVLTIRVNETPSNPTASNISICKDASPVTLSATATTGNSLLWYGTNATGGTGVATASIASTGTAGSFNYYVSQKSSLGCESSRTTLVVTVNPINTLTLSSASGTNAQVACINNPIANITYTTTGATGALVTGLPSGVSYNWSSNLLTISGIPTLSGLFTYSINLNGGCSSITTNGTINVNTISVAGTATASSSIICSGNTTTLSLSGNTGSIIWQQSSNGTTGWANVTTGTGSTTSSYTTAALPTTSYFRALVTNGACSSVNSNVLTIRVNETPSNPTASNISICKDASPVTLSATATTGNSLLWYGSDATGGTGVATANITSAATIGSFNFYVSQISTLGCESSRTKIIVNVYAYPATPVISRDGESNLVSSSAYGNKWYKDLVLISDTAKTIKPTAAGNYTALAVQNYCVSKMSAPYYYVNTITDLGNLSMSEFIKIYPNPIVNILKVDFNLNKYLKLNIGVYDATSGNKLIDLKNKTTGTSIDVSGLSAGMYIVVLSSSDNQLNYKEKIMKL